MDAAYATAFAACAYAVETKGWERTRAMLRAARGSGNAYAAGGFADARAFDAGLRAWVSEQV